MALRYAFKKPAVQANSSVRTHRSSEWSPDTCHSQAIVSTSHPLTPVLQLCSGRNPSVKQDSIMNIRDANKADAQTCGRILYNAFKKLAEQHNFPPDFPSPEVAAGLASMQIAIQDSTA
jgi:hypothetical protein